MRFAWVLLLAGCAGVEVTPSFAKKDGPPEMVVVGDEVFLDAQASGDQRAWLTRGADVAYGRVRDVFGPLKSERPSIFGCASDACIAHYVGPTLFPRAIRAHEGAPGATYVAGDRPAILIPRIGGRAANLIAHELVHVEIFARVGKGKLPVWFDEGLAASIGNQPPCEDLPKNGVADVKTFVTPASWELYVTQHPDAHLALCCQARAAVEAWAGEADGNAKLARLLDAIAAGETFDEAFRPISAGP
jgi:hypothetical protein